MRLLLRHRTVQYASFTPRILVANGARVHRIRASLIISVHLLYGGSAGRVEELSDEEKLLRHSSVLNLDYEEGEGAYLDSLHIVGWVYGCSELP